MTTVTSVCEIIVSISFTIIVVSATAVILKMAKEAILGDKWK